MIFLQLTYNLSLLIALSLLSGFINQKKLSPSNKSVIQGVIFGFVAMIGMLYPVNFAPGLIFDGRSVVISLCALFFGPVPAIISAVLPALLRLYQGGIGTLPGILVITESAIVGLIFHHVIFRSKKEIRIRFLFLMGLIVHIIMVSLMFTLPSDIAMSVVKAIGIPVITIYPIATILIGKIISDSLEKNEFVNRIKKNEKFLSQLIEHSGTLVFVKDKDGRYLLINGRWEEATGLRRENVIGKTDNEVFSKDNADRFRENDLKVINEERIIELEETLSDVSGTKNFISVKFPVYDENGDINGVCGMTTEITKLKIMENELRESEKKFKSLYDYAPIPYQSLDEKGYIIDVNPLWLTVLGYVREEVIGKWFGDFVSPDLIDQFRLRFPEFIKNGSVNNVHFKMKKKSGEYLDVVFEGIIAYDHNGRFKQTYCVFRDLTELKIAESNLSTLSLKHNAVLETVPDIIMEVDNNKVYTWANKAGYDFFGDDVIGQEAAHYFEGEQPTYDIVKPLFEGKEDVIYVESFQRRKDGEVRLLAWWCKVNKDEKGNVTGGISSARDITEQKEYEVELGRKNKELSEMNSLMVGRELKMIELKKEVNGLLKELNKGEKYDI